MNNRVIDGVAYQCSIYAQLEYLGIRDIYLDTLIILSHVGSM